jgi:osmotically-inducible protein OsmY
MSDKKTVCHEVWGALLRDPRTSSSRIRVKEAEGQVTLEGVARSHRCRLAAQEVAASVPGVTRVENHLTLAPMTRVPDE